MQFTDLNPELTPFQRRYVAYVKRCDEIERKIRYLHAETKSLDIPIKPAGEMIEFIESPTGQLYFILEKKIQFIYACMYINFINEK